jgi:hypothetical protein
MERLTELSLKYRGIAIAILAGVTVILGAGTTRVEQAFGFRVLVGEDHPAIQALDSLVAEYSGGFPVRIVWECGPQQPCETVFDDTSLRMADRLTGELLSAPHVSNVTSPANAAVFGADPDGITVDRFVENGVINEQRTQLAQRALEDSLWVNKLISPDGLVGAIIVQPSDNRPETDLTLVNSIERALLSFRSNGFRFYLVGDAIETVVGGRTLANSTSQLTPFLVLIITIVLFFTTRSWQQTIATLLTMGIAIVWTLGTLGWLGWPQNGMLQVLAPVVVIVGVCDAIHLLNHYSESRLANPNQEVQQGLRAAARGAGPACLITTLTSAAAFASFTVSALDAFVRFGGILPVGVSACLVLTFTALPIILTWLPEENGRTAQVSGTWRPIMNAVIETTSRRATTILVTTTLSLCFFGLGWALHLRADQDWIESYGELSAIVQDIRFTEEHFGSSSSLELDITLPPGTRIEAPDVLATIKRFSEGLSLIGGLEESRSILDLIERTNRLLHAGHGAFETAGTSIGANAEMLELLAFDDPDALGRWISLDRSRLRISTSTLAISQDQKAEALAGVETWRKATIPDSWDVRLTGTLASSHHWMRDIQATQLRSFPVAFGIVFVMVGLFLRSWSLALAAMLPTLLPVVIVLGTMGWLGMSLDIARAMIAAVIIGIGVDDAVHVLDYYKRRRSEGESQRLAITAALHHTGRAVVTTSVALSLGFLTLMMSAWQTVASFGFFVALSITGALTATLFVLPALLFALAPEEQN